MNWRRSVREGTWKLLFVFAIAGCVDRDTTAPRNRGPAVTSSVSAVDVTADVARELQAAVQGRTKRGEQDEMLRVEAQVPGFGGFFLDSADRLVAYLKDTTSGRADSARAALAQRYSRRPDVVVRQITADIGRTEIRVGRYSLAELIAMQGRIATRKLKVFGIVAYGPNIEENRLIVAFESQATLDAGLPLLAQIGVPAEALIAQVWPPVVASGTWIQTYRPTRAGILITLGRGSPLGVYSCSNGFNVYRAASVPAEVNYTLTAAHCIKVPWANGARTNGDTIWQAGVSNGAIRTVAYNPAWPTTSCPQASDGQPAEFCPDADVLLASPLNGVVGERKVGTSTMEGVNGTWGTEVINGWYPISGVVAPELIARGGRNVIHKSGFKSGTTTGPLAGTAPPPNLLCGGVEVEIDQWGTTQPASMQYVLPCAYAINSIGSGKGDSGGPVFARQAAGGTYYALGIMVAGTIQANGACTSGLLCQVIFNDWATIQTWLNAGTLDPATTIP